ncbi:MAG: glycosyltransferase family 39 protein [Bacteroidota bacterium]
MPVKALLCTRGKRLLDHPRFLVTTMVLALVFRVIWVIIFHPSPISDFKDYFQLASTWAESGTYGTPDTPTAYRPPGYPFLLRLVFGVTGPQVWVGWVLQIACSMGIIWLGYLLSLRWWHRPRAARITLILLAFSPDMLTYSSLLASELWFTLLLFAGCTTLASPSKNHMAFLRGLFWGAAALTRPVALLFPLAFFPGFFVAQKSKSLGPLMKKGALALLGMCLIISPWTLRNQLQLGEKVLISTNGGINLLIGSYPEASGGWNWNAQLEQTYLLQDSAPKNEVEKDQLAWQTALEHIQASPGRWLLLGFNKWVKTFGRATSGPDWIRDSYQGIPLSPFQDHLLRMMKGGGVIFYLIIIALFIRNLPFHILRAYSPSTLMNVAGGLWLMAGMSLSIFIFFGDPRYQFPIISLMMLYAASGKFCTLAEKRKRT